MAVPKPDIFPGVQFIEYIEDIPALSEALRGSVRHHRHLCPRQVLGARIGLAGLQALATAVDQTKKELLVIAETDGCFLSGLEAATEVSVNHRTLRVADYGKIASTFVHVASNRAYRISLQPDVRQKAWSYTNGSEHRHYFAMLTGYQLMPGPELLVCKPVALKTPALKLISRPGIRTICDACGEEVINEREVHLEGKTFCRVCYGEDGYYSEQKEK